jgi:type I restriction enzyme M protein
MLGAIIGDIAGSRFERHNIKTKKFDLFTDRCRFTDDSVMTLAVARAILDCEESYNRLSDRAIVRMREIGRRYPNCGYGGMFYKWLLSETPLPYNSFGNGAAMRVSACGFAAKSVEEAILLSKKVTEVTHNHPEGLKGAEAAAVSIFLAREKRSFAEIRKHIEKNYYPLNFTLDGIRESYRFDVTCQGSVPQAIEAFLESADYEDAIRGAISIGGDSDTLAAITGGIAEAYYGIQGELRRKALTFLNAELISIVEEFEKKYSLGRGQSPSPTLPQP